MGCRNDYMAGSESGELGELEEKIRDLKQELDKVTNLLCRTCKVIKRLGLEHRLPGQVKKWWEDHQRADRIRVGAALIRRSKRQADKKAKDKQKQLAGQALAKLSPAEREALKKEGI